MYPSYLMHYGVKGQKWGERQFQYKDGTYTPLGKERRRIKEKDVYFMPKGKTVYRLTSTKEERPFLNDNRYFYTDVDKKVYEGAFGKFLKIYGKSKKVYKKTYITEKDLVAPSEKKAYEIMEKRLLSDRNVMAKTTAYAIGMIRKGHPFASRIMAHMKEPNITQERRDELNKQMTLAAYNSMLENDKEEFNNFLNSVKKSGYNAVLDYNNVRKYNDAVEPFIAINASKSLKEIDSEMLEGEYIEKTLKELEEEIGRKPYL